MNDALRYLLLHSARNRLRGQVARLKRPRYEVVGDGIETTLPLFRALVREKDIIDGNYHIHWLEQFLARGGMES